MDGAERELIEKRIIEIIAKELNVDVNKITSGTDIQYDLGVDSIEFADIIMTIEDEYDVKLDRYEWMRTPGQIQAHVSVKLASKKKK